MTRSMRLYIRIERPLDSTGGRTYSTPDSNMDLSNKKKMRTRANTKLSSEPKVQLLQLLQGRDMISNNYYAARPRSME